MIKLNNKGAPVKFKKLVDVAIKEAGWQLAVQNYSISFCFPEKNKPHTSSGRRVAASIHVDRRYLTAMISIYPWWIKAWQSKDYTDTEITEAIFHEVSHVVTQHFYDVALATYRDEGETGDAWETLTQVVGRLAFRLAKKDGKFK